MENEINMLRVGDIFRYSDKTTSHEIHVVEELPNYYAATHTPGQTVAKLVKGICTLKTVKLADGTERMPVIIINSSPRNVGREKTPWENYMDPDNGYARYFGDNSDPDTAPEIAQGNRRLLEQFKLHQSDDAKEREKAAPIVIFERVETGYLRFNGIGIISHVERVMQRAIKKANGKKAGSIGHKYEQYAFANFAFEIVILNLSDCEDRLNWAWISARRDPSLTNKETLAKAPDAWKEWVASGSKVLPSIRRSVAKASIIKTKEQIPDSDSRVRADLVKIYNFYTQKKKKHAFEYLAAKIAERLFKEDGVAYTPGWITKASGDGGADFVGRIDISTGFSKLRIVVLGQAKCEKIQSGTSGKDIARLVARLRRGWVGIYVTTGVFSEAMQKEIIEDRYPIMMVNGEKVARLVREMATDDRMDITEYLAAMLIGYEKMKQAADVRRLEPEQVLFKV